MHHFSFFERRDFGEDNGIYFPISGQSLSHCTRPWHDRAHGRAGNHSAACDPLPLSSRIGAPSGLGGAGHLARALSEARIRCDSLDDSARGTVAAGPEREQKASHVRWTVAQIRRNTLAQTQSETLTRRDALATGATMLGATTFATMGFSADEPKSRRKLRIGVVGGGFGTWAAPQKLVQLL